MNLRFVQNFALQLIGILKWIWQAAVKAINRQTSFGLYDFPDEILLSIMIHMDEEDLLATANVCNRFRSIAKDAFGNKFCGSSQYFCVSLERTDDSEETKYESYFNIFGENMSAIEIDSKRGITIDRNHWLMVQIQNRCNSITHLRIRSAEVELVFILPYMLKLKYLELNFIGSINESWPTQSVPHLIHFEAYFVKWTYEELVEFLNNNGQLETLRLRGLQSNQANFIQALNGMQLKNLCLDYQCPDEQLIDPMPNSIVLPNLETLELHSNPESCINILNAMAHRNNITKINVECNEWSNDIVDALCQYKNLESIVIFSKELESAHLNRMVEQLPNLKKVNLDSVSDFINIGKFIAHTILFSTKWENISICLPKMPELKHSLIFEIAEATQNNPLLKIKLFRSKWNWADETIAFYRGVVHHNNAILYRTTYDHIHSKSSMGLLDLNERCIQKILHFMSLNDLAALFNTCESTQQAVKFYLNENIVRAEIVPALLDENVLQCLGEYIFRASFSQRIDFYYDDFHNGYMNQYYGEAQKFWQDVNRYCVNLNELIVDHFNDYRLNKFNHPWPNLTKFKLTYCQAYGHENLLKFTCPKLTHLEIGYFEEDSDLPFGNSFPRLTSLKFRVYNEDVRQLLMSLDGEFCQQIQHLSLGKYTEADYIRKGGKINKKRVCDLNAVVSNFHNAAELPYIILDCGKLLKEAQ